MAAIDERIEALEKQLKQAKERKRKIEAKQKALQNKKDRAAETRRKILVGAAVMAKVARGEWPEGHFNAMMDAALSRADDRALFGLDAQPEQCPSRK